MILTGQFYSESPTDDAEGIMKRNSCVAAGAFACLVALLAAGCRSPFQHRTAADRAAGDIIRLQQRKALGRTEPFAIERPADTLRRRLMLDQTLPHSGAASLNTKDLRPIEHWPADGYLHEHFGPAEQPAPGAAAQGLRITLMDALQIGARNSRDYQSRKEDVFRAALDLDLERDDFRASFAGALQTLISVNRSGDSTVTGTEQSASASVTRRLKSGATITTSLALDLVKLLTQDEDSARGLLADATIALPLLRGASRHIVAEPLTQAERDVIYAIWTFERYKRTLAVEIASGYLNVLRQLDEVRNREASHRRLRTAELRARRLADAGRLPDIQVDQAMQDELRARNRWIQAQQTYARRLDAFKVILGLPADARVDLDTAELDRLGKAMAGFAPAPEGAPSGPPGQAAAAAPGKGGPLELDEAVALKLALENRLDLRAVVGKVYDAQRQVVVAADDLRADVTLQGSGSVGASRSVGSATSRNANLHARRGKYEALLKLDLPLERTAERNAYRESYIDLERAVRSVQETEDQVKLQIRNHLRSLLESRESLLIQQQATEVAQRRVDSTDMFLQAGRAQIRDVLDAQEALVAAQNALTAATVNYWVAELELQRDMGVLRVDENGLWQEYVHEEANQ